MAELASFILVIVGIFSERVDVLFVAALFALTSKVDIHINLKLDGDKHDG